MTEKILQPTVNNYLSSSQISKSKTLCSHHDGQSQVLEQSSSRNNLQVAAMITDTLAQDYNVQCAMAGSYYTQAHTTLSINMEIYHFKL